jgi:uncharacterized protein (UPF0335 family)
MTTLQGAAQKQLQQFVEQLERLEADKREIAESIRDKFLEAKAVGFDVKILRQVLALRKKSKAEREEEDAILTAYLHALNMLDGTPMGDFVKPGAETLRTTVRKAVKRLAEMAEEDKTTVSINGGPAVPFPSSAATNMIDRWKSREQV